MNLYLRLLRVLFLSGRRPRLTLADRSRTPFRVAPGDLDMLGHMNNGRYLTLMDLGRLDLMTRSGTWGRIKELGWYPVVAAQTISYRKSLTPGQAFDIHTEILGLDDTGAYLRQRFTVGTAVHAEAIVRARFLKRSGGTVSTEELQAAAGVDFSDREVPAWVRSWAESSRVKEKEIA